MLADIKPSNKSFFKGVHAIFPNLKEAKEMTGGMDSDVGEIGKKLVDYFGADVFITRGGDGISLCSRDGLQKHFPARRVKVFDVSGAGDTVLAVASLGYSSSIG